MGLVSVVAGSSEGGDGAESAQLLPRVLMFSYGSGFVSTAYR